MITSSRPPFILALAILIFVALLQPSLGHAANPSVTLMWAASTGTIDGYKVERAVSSSGPWSEITQTAPGVTSFTDTTLDAGMNYYYRVRAYNSAGNSDYSNVAEGSTPATVVVASPTDCQSTTNSSLSVSGTAAHVSGIKSVTVNGQTATLNGTAWSRMVTLVAGTNNLTVAVTDSSPMTNVVTQLVRAVYTPPAVLPLVPVIVDGGIIAFKAASYSVSESSSTVTVSLIRTGVTTSVVGVTLTTVDGTATAGADYVARTTNVTFAAGVTSVNVTLALLPDTIDELNESFQVGLSNPTGGATLGTIAKTTVTVTDDDSGGTLAFSAAGYSVSETGVVARIMVNRTGGTASAVTVTARTSDGTATAPADYSSVETVLTFSNGQTSATFAVPVIDDGLGEGNETVSLALVNPTGGATLGAQKAATLTIVDNEQVLQFAKATFTNAESVATATITVMRSGPSGGTATVQYATSDWTAASPADYAAKGGTLTFGPGVVSASFTVPVVNDTLDETNETVHLTLSNPTGGAFLGPLASATLLITDDDSGGMIAFSAANYTVAETSPTVTVKLTRTGGIASGVEVTLSTVDGTATAGADYVARTTNVAFAAGVTSMSVAFPLLSDTIDETNETFRVNLSNPTGGATLGAIATTSVTITDDDSGGSLAFSASNYSVSETNAVATITVTRTGGTASGVSVDVGMANLTAIAGDDYTLVSPTIYFAAGEVRKSFTVPILDDIAVEGNETIQVVLSNPTGGATLGAQKVCTVTIGDNELPSSSDVLRYLVAKGQDYEQASTALPVLREGEPHLFDVDVQARVSNSVTAVTLQTPTGSNETLTAEADGLGLTLGKSFGVKADLDLAYGLGNYTLTIVTAKDGLKTLTLGFSTENYPATPHISNWSALQGVNSTASLTISWDSSRQGKAYADAIQLEVVDAADEVVFSTPDIGGLGVLTGQTTSLVIPAKQLQPGQVYRCRLVFMKFSSQNTSYPGAKGFGVYYRQTHFTFTTAN